MGPSAFVNQFLLPGDSSTDNAGYPPDTPVPEPNLDAVRVHRGIGQDILDNPPCHFSASLVLLEDDVDSAAGADSVTARSVRLNIGLFVHGNQH